MICWTKLRNATKLKAVIDTVYRVDSKVEKILEDSLDSIPSPSTSMKIQIIGGKVYLS